MEKQKLHLIKEEIVKKLSNDFFIFSSTDMKIRKKRFSFQQMSTKLEGDLHIFKIKLEREIRELIDKKKLRMITLDTIIIRETDCVLKGLFY